MMKITTLLLFLAIMQVSATGYTQNISLSATNAPLIKLFKEIRKQSNYNFLYTKDLLKSARPVIIKVNSVAIKDVLNEIFAGQSLTYTISNNTIVIKEKEFSSNEIARAMQMIINGKITDETGKPLPGVTVYNKNSKKRTATAADGTYSIAAIKGDQLAFSFIGFKDNEVVVGANSIINMNMQESTSALDQVVVVGYGNTTRRDLTGSVSTIAVKDIADIPFNTIDNALAGKAAGVQVTKTDGSPGGAVRIRIRGSSSLLGGNDPLYVIDGVPVQVQSNFLQPGYSIGSPVGDDMINPLQGSASNAGLSTSFINGLNSLGGLNIDDIESISILKDASSTAIYGSKAANGVVIISTKKGRKDMKPQITANYYTTINTAVNPDLLNGTQYRQLLTEAAQNDYDGRKAAGAVIPANVTAILFNPSTFFGSSTTDWLEEVTENTVSHNAELAVQGGSSKSRYYNSVSFTQMPGVLSASDYQRVTGKLNLENEIGDHFRMSSNIVIGYTDQNLGVGAYAQALRARPDYAPFDDAGNYTVDPSGGRNFQNPLAWLTSTNNARTFSLIGSLTGAYHITKGLVFKSTVSLNMQTYNQRTYNPSYLQVGSVANDIAASGGIGSNANSRLANWFLENTLNYSKSFSKKHTIDVLAGYSYETRKTSFFSATATGYPNDNVLNNLSSAITPILVQGDDPSKPQSYLLSFYLRANYGYLDRYLFTFTGRSDGSSKFGTDNKFGYFPSGAIAWRVSEEKFLKKISWITDIKFRGSYGLTGNQNIGDQMYRTLYSPYSYGGTNALIPTQLGNQRIKWESTRQADAGFDISIFDSRLQITADYYHKKTSGALLSLPIAPSSSFGSLLSNAVGIKNTGYELSINGDIIRSKDFKWSTSANITWNKSKVTKLSPEANLTQIGDRTGLELGNTTLIEGMPLGLITGVTVTGIIKNQAELDAYKKRMGRYASRFPYLNLGDPIFALNNENSATGSLTNYNTIIASAAPKYFGGFSQGFTYKKLDLQLYFTYSYGGQLVWGDHISSTQFRGYSNANVSMLDRYTSDNSTGTQPRLLLNYGVYYKSNLDVFSSSYLKLRTVSFSYHFSKMRWMEKSGIRDLSVFASASNIFTITKYPGVDPETSNDPYSVAGGYLDVSNYPAVRTFSAGIKSNF